MNAAEDITVASEDRLRADLYNYLGLMLAGPGQLQSLQPARPRVGVQAGLQLTE